MRCQICALKQTSDENAPVNPKNIIWQSHPFHTCNKCLRVTKLSSTRKLFQHATPTKNQRHLASPRRRSLQGLEPVGLHARPLLLRQLNFRPLGAACFLLLLQACFFWSRVLWGLFVGSLSTWDSGFLL